MKLSREEIKVINLRRKDNTPKKPKYEIAYTSNRYNNDKLLNLIHNRMDINAMIYAGSLLMELNKEKES